MAVLDTDLLGAFLRGKDELIGGLIGGSCLAHAETLFTRNVVHFSTIDGLVVVDGLSRHASKRNL